MPSHPAHSPYFMRQGSSLAWILLSRLGWLDNEPLCTHLPYARIRDRHHHAGLLHSSPHTQQQDVLTELQPQCSLDWP